MLLYWIWLAMLDGVREREKQMLLAHFETPEDCFYADAESYAQLEELSEEAVAALAHKDLKEAEAVLNLCAKRKIHVLTFGDEAYPDSLRNIADPPLVLYYRGMLPAFREAPVIGVVGTRKASAYGLTAARQLGKELAQHGGIVVSGMAEGIDAMATQGALEGNGFAIGVLGCGVDIVYPRCNRELFRKMEQQGCLISEYPPETAPNRWNFPRRNRIISGISCGVVVVEAPEKSGALITARQALEQGRDVFAVPGNIGVGTCAGSNALLKDGAAVVTCGWDILEEYAARYPDKIRKEIPKTAPVQVETDKKPVDKMPLPNYSGLDQKADEDLDAVEKAFLQALGNQERLVDTVIAEMGLPSGDVLAALTMLEVKGYVVTRPGGWVAASEYH